MNRLVFILRKTVPVLVPIILFLIVSIVCFAPQLEGRVLPQHDIQQFDGMSRDIRECRADYDEDPKWTGAMFGGMPAYLINIRYPAQILKHSVDVLLSVVHTPAGFIFFAMIAAWLMFVMMGMSTWIGVVVGLAYGLSTYFFLIIGAGHETKMWALVFAPMMLGAIFMTLRGDRLKGGVLTSLFASLEIGANHPQITYYFILAIAALWINDMIFAIRERYVSDFMKRTGIIVAAMALAVGSNFAPLWYTAKHTNKTIRGGSEIVDDTSHGLDLQYATAWSYGISESGNMLIPNLMGGSSGCSFSKDGAVSESLKEFGLEGLASHLPAYWGDQPYTAGPTYVGAVAIFLALLGILLATPRDRWWILISGIFALFLSWGHNFMWFTEICFKYLPLYSKFRTVSMSLVVVELVVPLLAGMALVRIWQYVNNNKTVIEKQILLRETLVATVIVGGVALIFAIFGGSIFDFGREASGEMMSEQFRYMLEQSGGEEYVRKGVHEEIGWSVADAMAKERNEIMIHDAWRSFAFVVMASIAVMLFIFNRIRRGWLVALLAGLVIVDMLPIGLRYQPYDNFVSERNLRISPTEADCIIMADKEIGYRVLNLSVSPFNDATTSMFHRSVGGYHGAKLGRYQDLIDLYLTKFDEGVLDMLNTKYVITSEGTPISRDTANGAAWFVEDVVYAANSRQELELLGNIDLKKEAVVQSNTISDELSDILHNTAQPGEIALTEYRPNYLKYEYAVADKSIAIFSEIYYPDGWTMYVDGRESPYFCADYILRAAIVPAGKHIIEWRFEAPNWNICEGITFISSIFIIFAVIWLIAYCAKSYRWESCRTMKH